MADYFTQAELAEFPVGAELPDEHGDPTQKVAEGKWFCMECFEEDLPVKYGHSEEGVYIPKPDYYLPAELDLMPAGKILTNTADQEARKLSNGNWTFIDQEPGLTSNEMTSGFHRQEGGGSEAKPEWTSVQEPAVDTGGYFWAPARTRWPESGPSI